ncbi:uncharacterized protein PF11_0213-like [Acyrthosiphon pisum]|uniref:Peptidase S1 domain-containing protein n=1 Tax=Acyrthosiphon pisum TaxID=7029 RepID=A0A8R1WY94_ACYPI|nr:uncharacterized protein PF11_0213-like [Acyrthosiphon pisum]|eukprot:XP_008178643.1 PREDICTED: uncharacterized protein PF11_0213-like [Acyrthosiphon pisum]
MEGWRIETKVRNGENAPTGRNLKNWKEFLCSATGTTQVVCQGDSGGPMICNGKLYGVCSFYYNFKGGKNECGSPDIQTLHVFLYHYLKWIYDIIDPKKDGDDKNDENDKKDENDKNDKNDENDKNDKKDKKKKKKKKKKRRKNSGNSLKPHLTMYTILAILFYMVY